MDVPLAALRGIQDGEGVGGAAEADVPDHEGLGMGLETLGEPGLLDVEGLSFGDGADDGVAGFAVGVVMDGEGAVGEGDELESAFRHEGSVVGGGWG